MADGATIYERIESLDPLVQLASALRGKLLNNGWTTDGAETLTQLFVSAALDD